MVCLTSYTALPLNLCHPSVPNLSLIKPSNTEFSVPLNSHAKILLSHPISSLGPVSPLLLPGAMLDYCCCHLHWSVSTQSIFLVVIARFFSCYEKTKLLYFSEPEQGLKPREKSCLQKISPVLRLQREENTWEKRWHIFPLCRPNKYQKGKCT